MRWAAGRRWVVNSVFFGLKRAHWSTVKVCLGILREAKSPLTPGRYDLLMYLRHHDEDEEITQKDLRAAFGVSRATMSEAILALVDRGLVWRSDASDSRTFRVRLTQLGRRTFDHARSCTKWLLERVMEKLFPDPDIMRLHDAVTEYEHTRRELGDTAVLELKPLWHPDD